LPQDQAQNEQWVCDPIQGDRIAVQGTKEKLIAADRALALDSWALLADIHIAENRDEIARGMKMAVNLERAGAELLALPEIPAGVLVNGDFIKPDGTTWEYEPGRFEIARHLELLRTAGFPEPKSLAHLEPNLRDPTPAQNYACLVAVK